MDYKIMTSSTRPEINSIIVEARDPDGPFGAKGVGEIGINLVLNRVRQHRRHRDRTHIHDLPLTPERVLRAAIGETR